MEGRHRSETRDVNKEIERYRKYYHEVMNRFHLSQHGEETAGLAKVNALAWWYTHNMLVHYSVPTGWNNTAGLPEDEGRMSGTDGIFPFDP